MPEQPGIAFLRVKCKSNFGMFKNLVFTFAIVLVSINLAAQKYSVGIVGGTYLSSAAESIETSAVMGFNLTHFGKGVNLGIQSEYKLNKNISIGTGIAWHRFKFVGTCYCYVCDKVFVTPIELKINVIEIPVFLRTYFIDQSKRLAPFISTGLSNRFLKMEDVKFGYSLNLNLAAGTLINITEHWAILLEADIIRGTFKRNSSFIDPEERENTYPYFDNSSSLWKAGIYWKF